MIFWAIEQGSYSDYSMGPFFTTEELAEAYVARHCPSDDGHQERCYHEYSYREIEILDHLPRLIAHQYATIDVNGEITFGVESLREEPVEYSRRDVVGAKAELSGPKDRVVKVAGEISAERKAWKAGLSDPPPGWPPEPYRPTMPRRSPPVTERGRYPDAFHTTPSD